MHVCKGEQIIYSGEVCVEHNIQQFHDNEIWLVIADLKDTIMET